MPPTHFYKYRPFDVHSESLLREGQVWFSHVADFNDPFDCQIGAYVEQGSDDALMDMFMRRIPLREPHLSPGKVRRVAKKFLRKHREMTQEKLEAEAKRAAAEIARKIGVYCLTVHRDNMLMWAHYADKHRGICFEFDAEHAFFRRAAPVAYSAQHPQVSLFDLEDRQRLDELCLRTKSLEWAYEDEYRIIYRYGTGAHCFPVEALTGVVIGCQAEKGVRRQVRAHLKARGCTAQLHQARKKSREYGLLVEPL